MKNQILTGFIFILLFSLGCQTKQQQQPETTAVVQSDPLPSWNDGVAKQSVIDFVKAVTTENSPDFVKPGDRIATFDNDGTLWSEQPYYFQLQFALDRIKELAPSHPEWKKNQLFQAVLNNDIGKVLSFGEKGLLELVTTTHSGISTEEFAGVVKNWIDMAIHPKTQLLYKEMVFQPMIELLDFLRANGFKTYIVSGGGVDFMRPWIEEVYGIPAEQVVGSSGKVKFEMKDGNPVLIKLPEINFIDDKEGKPVGIHQYIGKRPIAAFGNSDGDLQMLQYTAAGEGKRFLLYVHHTDSVREWAYDRDSHIGKLDKGLDEAIEKGWIVVDMKNDWNRIYGK
ncbi:MAG TPA: HAD family hydrolase [Draconibacterium sp.]|nr:HAD family hydrolase [Draconibacterium sp.]